MEKLETRTLYRDGAWDAIVTHPQFDLGYREFHALSRFVPVVARHIQGAINILHLGVGNGREVPLFTNRFQIGTYVINDICEPVLRKVAKEARAKYPSIHFEEELADIEQNSAITKLREKLNGKILIVLAGNAVIFSHRGLDTDINRAMEKDDLFLITVETPHKHMFDSYTIEPVYRLLERGGLQVNAENTKAWYDKTDQCLKIFSQDKLFLSSYKPTEGQLRKRLKNAGMVDVVFREYKDLHMLAGLFKKDSRPAFSTV